MNIVIVGAHPDDIEIGVGGSFALHQCRGDSVRFLVLTAGEELSEGSQRRREARAAAEIIDSTASTFWDIRIRRFCTAVRSSNESTTISARSTPTVSISTRKGYPSGPPPRRTSVDCRRSKYRRSTRLRVAVDSPVVCAAVLQFADRECPRTKNRVNQLSRKSKEKIS